jgi:folate-binding Fe-S cluster repair protein YgfZ
VARVHNLGRPPRRLVFLHLDGSVVELPPHGAAVTVDGRQVGFVGSSAGTRAGAGCTWRW